MSDLAATNCGCASNDNGCSWIIILCSCAVAVVTATDLVVSAAVVETAAAAPSSGSYLFFAAADAVSKALHHKTLPLSDNHYKVYALYCR